MSVFGMHFRVVLGAVCCALILSACASKPAQPQQTQAASDSSLPGPVDKSKRAAIRMQLAVDYYQQGQYRVALDELKEVLSNSPDLVDAYNMRGLIYMDMKDNQLAEESFLHAAKLAPNNADVANNYGWFLCQTDRERQALPYFEKVLQDPRYATASQAKALNNAGICSLRLKDKVAAERYFMQGFRIDPGNPSINANIAKILYDRGEYDNALFYINRVVKADVMAADVLWLAIKIERKLGDQVAVGALSTQLRRRYPDSKEFEMLQKGAFNE